ncbi:hypothetical protein [Pelagicoccus albus]|uniref:Uncharacterized protein n=1 Tax=Pelagicoccus albus TaxID=415222 RepID=A0A7X1E726_9BACT|nr:hypothetical protein [Pelagicoccus albus]MBC2604698.1 hypothetical protein [Pelagicoccus albus]
MKLLNSNSYSFAGDGRLSSKRGNALITVLVMIVFLGGLTTVSIKDSLHAYKLAKRQHILDQVLYAAEAGIEEAARKLNSEKYYGMTPVVFVHELSEDLEATVTMTPLDAQSQNFRLTSVSTMDGISRTVTVEKATRPTYMEYGLYFEDFNNLWWIAGSITDGKVWTGTTQSISGASLANGEKEGPIFRDVNETLSGSFGGTPEYASYLSPDITLDEYEYSDLRFWSDYSEGYRTEVSKPALASVDFDEIANASNALSVTVEDISVDDVSYDDIPTHGAIILKGPTEIRFDVVTVGDQEVGIVAIKNKDAFGNASWHELYSESLDVIVVNDDLTTNNKNEVDGTVTISESSDPSILKGNLAIVSTQDTTIKGDIIYNDQALETSGDKLLIASKENIYIDRTDKNDMILQAGLMAAGLNSSGYIGLKDYDKYGVRGNLYFTGSMIGGKVYPFGNFSFTEGMLNGYKTHRFYDTRFLTDPPPFTPSLSNEIQFSGWH